MPESQAYADAKSALDTAIASAIGAHGAVPAQPCDGAGEQPSAAFTSNLFMIGNKLSEAQSLANSLVPACAVPPPPGAGNFFSGQTYVLGLEIVLGGADLSGMCFKPSNRHIFVMNENGTIKEVDRTGTVLRTVTFQNIAPWDAEAIMYGGQNPDGSDRIILHDEGSTVVGSARSARLGMINLPTNSTTFDWSQAEVHIVGDEMVHAEAVAYDVLTDTYHYPGGYYRWTVAGGLQFQWNPQTKPIGSVTFKDAFMMPEMGPNIFALTRYGNNKVHEFNPNTGAIVSQYDFTPLMPSAKYEGLAIDPVSMEVFICNEASSGIKSFRRFDPQ